MKIAIVKTSALGDIIHSAFILQFIKQKIPDARIDWIVEEKFASILSHHPDIDNILPIDLSSIKKKFSNIFNEIKRVRQYAGRDYDIVIDMQGLIKSAITSKLLGKNVAGYDKNSIREGAASFFYSSGYDVPYNLDTIDRYRLLASKALGIEITKDEVIDKQPYLFYGSNDFKISEPFFSQEKPNVLFIVGSTWESRIYPKEQFAAVAKALDANILVPFGNEAEKEFAEYLSAETDNVTVLPKMNLGQLKAAISHADLLIGNDTGPTYIAWANNIPSIILFGPTPPVRVYETTISKLLKSPSKVDPYKLDKNDFSIKEIGEQEIIKTAKRLLSQP